MNREADPHVYFYDHCARMSGAEISMLTTISALDTAVTVILGEHGPLVGRLVAEGAEVVALPLPAATAEFSRNRIGLSGESLRQALQVVRYSRGLAHELKSRSATVVVSNSMKGHVIVSMARMFTRFKVVFYLHDRIVPEFMSPAGVRLQQALVRLVPDAIVANSVSTMETAPTTRRQRARIVAGGPIQRPTPTGATPAASRGSSITVGLVGRISPWKGQDVAMRAFAQAFPSHGAVLELAGAPLFGEEQHLENLQKLAEDLNIADRVRFLGHVDDVYGLLRTWDVAVHASIIPEPFGLVVAQAMAVGAAVIASNEGGPAEMIEDGLTGLLIEPRNPSILAAAMLRLAHDPLLRRALGSRALSAVGDYMPEVVAGRLMTAVKAAASGRRPRVLP